MARFCSTAHTDGSRRAHTHTHASTMELHDREYNCCERVHKHAMSAYGVAVAAPLVAAAAAAKSRLLNGLALCGVNRFKVKFTLK